MSNRPIRHKPASASISSLSALFDNNLISSPPSPSGNNTRDFLSSPTLNNHQQLFNNNSNNSNERPSSGNWSSMMNNSNNSNNNNNNNSGNNMNTDYEEVQNRTFVKWVNTRLEPLGLPPLTDLAKDFSDGVRLIQLVEALTDEPLGQYNKSPIMKVQRYENAIKALDRIKEMGVTLTNIGAEDIVDGNLKLILGLIWSLVLRFSIADISEGGSNAKDGLMLWCQRVTKDYSDVDVVNFTRSFQDGLAFCALIHSHRPDLIDYDSLPKELSSASANMRLAFKIAAEELNVPQLFDVEDIVGARKPDERSIMTYVASMFHRFSTEARTSSESKTISNFVDLLGSLMVGIQGYEARARVFHESIENKTQLWTSTSSQISTDSFPTLIQLETDLTQYQFSQKKVWEIELGELKALLGNVQAKLFTYGLRMYNAPVPLRSEDLDITWRDLVKIELDRSREITHSIFEIQDRTRRRFAELANSFHSRLDQIELDLTNIHDPLESQTLQISTLQSELESSSSLLPSISMAQEESLNCEIKRNEDTIYTYEYLVWKYELLIESLKKRANFVENQLVARNRTNVKPEQLESYEMAFRAFDKESRNVLDLEEFAAALSSLGISEVSLDDVDRREDGNIDFSSFTKFLIERGEDRLSAHKVRSAFRGVAEDKPFITEIDLQRVNLSNTVINNLLDRMAAAECESEQGWEYAPFLDDLFQSE